MQADKLGVTGELPCFEDLTRVHDKMDPLQNWIVLEFEKTTRTCWQAIQDYEFSTMSSSLYSFAWGTFCDWYVEFLKTRMSDEAAAKSTLMTGFALMDGVLRLLHPMMPYITEEISQTLYPDRTDKSLGQSPLPRPNTNVPSTAPTTVGASEVIATVSAIRSLRGHYSISPADTVDVYLQATEQNFATLTASLATMAKARLHYNEPSPRFSAPAMGTPFPTWMALEGFVDPAKEKTRLEKRRAELLKHCGGLSAKLSNEKFVNSAPPQILKGARDQLNQNQHELSQVEEALTRLPL
jgi:valyl-tRNA synthetase